MASGSTTRNMDNPHWIVYIKRRCPPLAVAPDPKRVVLVSSLQVEEAIEFIRRYRPAFPNQRLYRGLL